MKNIFKEKFKNTALVKPLYRKLNNKIKPRIFITANDTFILAGHGVNVKKDVETKNGKLPKLKNNYGRKITVSCDICETNCVNSFEKFLVKGDSNDVRYRLKERGMLNRDENRKTHTILNTEDQSTKLVQTETKSVVLDKVTSTWLRLYPMPKLPQESACSVIFRCFLCQLGIFTFLVLWTIIFIFLIHYFEGPYEIKITTDFEKQQNRLVIDLATELRQITPLSPRWQASIAQRLEQARQMTSAAVVNGAMLRAGQYWNLPGTFLFTVYVMTALGFGAPLTQTVEGKISAILYAILAVPLHFYLMLNAAAAIVARVEFFMEQSWTSLRNKILIANKPPLDNESSNYSRNSELQKYSNRHLIGKCIVYLINILGVFRCIPIATILYYATGACIFGVLRDRSIFETTMFPLEFTTSGGLDRVPGHIRIIYGFYVEGAVILIGCALETLRRHSSPCIEQICKKYRLFENGHIM